jgi:hypothetical protein
MKNFQFGFQRALISLCVLILLGVVVMRVWHQSRPVVGQVLTGSFPTHGHAVGHSARGEASSSTNAVDVKSVTAEVPAVDSVANAHAGCPLEHPPVARQEQSVAMPVPSDFLKQILSVDEKIATIPLPDGGVASGEITYIQRDGKGLLLVQGNVTEPEAGKFMFQRQTAAGLAGSMVGHVHYHKSDIAYQVRPTGENGSPMLVKVPVDEVICRALPRRVDTEENPEEAPQTHPTTYPIPPSENGIIQLQSLPGATAVVYLDFDGEAETFPSWGYINALPSGSSNAQIYEVWKGVAEDYQPFNINITTVRAVYNAAPEGSRMHAILTPTNDAAPGAGGVAYVGSFNQTGHRVCWVFYTSGKSAVEVASHEVGHTVGLYHDGRISPLEGYYAGHNGWAPIMGVGYYQTLSQWSKGEYLSADNSENDLNIIVSNNNNVDYRADDYGSTYATSAWLDVAAGAVVSNEGIIETTGDQDAFRFSTSGGSVTLNINNVTFNPNLDIKAEIVTSAGVVVATSDSDTTASASFSALALAAGDYFLRVSGVGKGIADLSTGYTNYGSLGSYLITGTLTGGVTADHFPLAENAAVGSAVGTCASRISHGAGVVTRSISSGNASGTFAIDSASGAITVANHSLLNFETLSTRWDDPASFELFVSITDSLGVATESIRTVVTITDANEPPVAAALATQTLPENLAAGTVISTASAVDPDRTDYVTFSIASGNTGNTFAINSVTGVITVAGALDFETTPSYTLVVRATDHGSPANNVDTPLAINLVNTVEGYVPGTIRRAFYNNITGSTVANLTSNAKFPASPDSLTTLTSFDGGSSKGDNYGSTVCGYLIPPTTGNYTFWISSDDASELRLSPDTTPANAVARASVTTYTSQYAWTANASQQSTAIALTAGQAYYIEARHKEGGGGDHVAVAWQGPGMATKEVIPGKWLAPFNVNFAPTLQVASYTVRDNALAGQGVGTVTFNDLNPTDVISGYTITAGNTGAVFAINPVSGQLSLAKSGLLNASATPSYSLTIQATDNATPPLIGSGTVMVNVTSATAISVTGVVQEIWTGLSAGTTVSYLTTTANYPYKPNLRRVLSSFDSGADYSDYYGSRIRAKFIPPSSGNYQFYLSSDDASQLMFSTNPGGTGAAQIASLSSFSNPYEWTKYPSQTSAVQTLVAGQAVYLETLHKEGIGGDHVSVGYTGPGTAAATVIPGSLLLPFDINAPPVFSPTSYSSSFTAATATAGMSLVTVTATEPNAETLVYAILSGNSQGAFAIHPATGNITVTNPALLVNGDTTLQVAAQDGGLGGVYPLASATATVVLHVSATNSAPAFTSDPMTGTGATQNVAYSATLAGSATDSDAGDSLTFSKVSGPTWLNVATNGTLTGTPTGINVGANSFIVRTTDPGGLFDDAALNVSVVLANPAADSDGDGFTDALEFALGTNFESNASQPSSIYSGLRAWWKFDETSGTLADDTTGRLQDGTVNGGATWGTGYHAGGLTFDGVNDGVLVGTSAALTGTTDFTLSAWVKVAPGSSGGAIVQQRDATSLGYNGEYMLSVKSNGTIEFFIHRDGFQFNITSTDTVNDGQWHRVSATRSGTAGTIYIDGNSVATGSGVLKSLASLGVAIGYDYRDSINYFNGSMDDVRIYSRALSASEIAILAECVAPVFIADPFSRAAATEDAAYTATIAGAATDANAGDVLTYTRITGPSWLSISSSGSLSGMPANADVGSNVFTVRVTDSSSRFAQATLTISVINSNDAPVFATHPINAGSTPAGSAFVGSIADAATDPDVGDTLTYSKTTGPSWLNVASSGTLSGTPGVSDGGTKAFTVRATDTAGLFAEAVLNLTVTLTPVQTWQFTQFGANASNPAIAGDLADPDGDGLKNLLEYALGSNPNTANGSGIIPDMEFVNGTAYLRLTIHKNPAATDVSFTVESGSDFTDWSSATTVIESGTANPLIVRDSLTGSRRFMRLKVTR